MDIRRIAAAPSWDVQIGYPQDEPAGRVKSFFLTIPVALFPSFPLSRSLRY